MSFSFICRTIYIYHFTVNLILMGAVLNGANAMLYSFVHISSSEIRSVDSFWLLLAVTLNTWTFSQRNTHSIPVFTSSNGHYPLPSVLTRWEGLLTQTLSGSQSYNITRRTYLTDFFLFFSFFFFFSVSVQNPSNLSFRNSS